MYASDGLTPHNPGHGHPAPSTPTVIPWIRWPVLGDSSTSTNVPAPVILWEPNSQTLADTGIGQFTEFVNQAHDLEIPINDYSQLHAWSIKNLGEFWQSVADFAEINFTTPATTPLINNGVEHATWFPGATLNYAERALAITDLTPEDSVAVIAIREGAPTTEFTRGELRAQVACAQEGLRRLGVSKGDRVVALIPNCAEVQST
jgi:acetoacetyl-CoA synthetase